MTNQPHPIQRTQYGCIAIATVAITQYVTRDGLSQELLYSLYAFAICIPWLAASIFVEGLQDERHERRTSRDKIARKLDILDRDARRIYAEATGQTTTGYYDPRAHAAENISTIGELRIDLDASMDPHELTLKEQAQFWFHISGIIIFYVGLLFALTHFDRRIAGASLAAAVIGIFVMMFLTDES